MLVVLAVTGVALAAASFTDPAGDDNAAPDITSVTVTETGDGVFDVRVEVANYRTLPPSSWINLWFDVDGDRETGDSAGDEALVRFSSDGSVQLRLWEGEEFVSLPSDDIAAGFEGGVLSVRFPLTVLGSTLDSPGLLVVAARSSVIGMESLTGADFSPEDDRARWTRPGRTEVRDAEGDNNAAPDITTIDVSDTKDGWIRFAIATPNRGDLPRTSFVAVAVDRDSNRITGHNGADVTVTTDGEEVQIDRWDPRAGEWVDDTPPTRARARNGSGVVTIEVHRSELGDPGGFSFRAVSGDASPLTGGLVAVDFAPDSGAFWRYALTHPAHRLVAGRATGLPVRPRAGKRFTVRAPVRRSDTNRAIAAGTVTCAVRSDRARVRASGRVRAGAGQCAFVVPRGARTISGSMTVRSGGRVVTSRFRFTVG